MIRARLLKLRDKYDSWVLINRDHIVAMDEYEGFTRIHMSTGLVLDFPESFDTIYENI